jgi:hypothetical protein
MFSLVAWLKVDQTGSSRESAPTPDLRITDGVDRFQIFIFRSNAYYFFDTKRSWWATPVSHIARISQGKWVSVAFVMQRYSAPLASTRRSTR